MIFYIYYFKITKKNFNYGTPILFRCIYLKCLSLNYFSIQFMLFHFSYIIYCYNLCSILI